MQVFDKCLRSLDVIFNYRYGARMYYEDERGARE